MLANLTPKTILIILSLVGFLLFAFLDVFQGKPFAIGYFQATGMAVCGLLFAATLWPSRPRRVTRFLGILVTWLSWAIGGVAAILMAINLVGIPLSMRNADMYTIPVVYGGKQRLALYTPEDVYAQMAQQPEEDRKEYLVRLTNLIFDGTIHYWREEGLLTYNLQVPIYENFILFLDHYGEIYTYCDAKRAIERGATVCEQSSVILMSVLHAQGITTRQYALEGHTVALVEVDPSQDEWWFADADFGAVIPMDYRQVEENPDVVASVYADAGYANKPGLLNALAGIYESTGNHSLGTIDNFKFCEREAQAYSLKWLIPGVGLLQMPLIAVPLSLMQRRAKARPSSRPS